MGTTTKNPYRTKRVKKEAVIERHLVREVVKFGGVVRKVAFPGHAGAPDRVVMFPGGVLAWVELKTTVGKISPIQQREHALLQAMGQRVEVVWSEREVTSLVEELYVLYQVKR